MDWEIGTPTAEIGKSYTSKISNPEGWEPSTIEIDSGKNTIELKFKSVTRAQARDGVPVDLLIVKADDREDEDWTIVLHYGRSNRRKAVKVSTSGGGGDAKNHVQIDPKKVVMLVKRSKFRLDVAGKRKIKFVKVSGGF